MSVIVKIIDINNPELIAETRTLMSGFNIIYEGPDRVKVDATDVNDIYKEFNYGYVFIALS